MKALAIVVVLAMAADVRADDLAGDLADELANDLANDLANERAEYPQLATDDGRGRARVVANAPPVAKVVAAAVRAQGLAGDPARAAARRARLAGLVPLVAVRAGNTASWRDAEDGVGRGASLEVRATWRLDRLVFDGRELQAQAMSMARQREKRRLAARVIRAYFIWKRAALAGAVVRREESEAELDALTDGWFSQARLAPSEVRTVDATP